MSESYRQYTFVHEHSPNCPSPDMVRMVGHGQGHIDKLFPTKSKDAIGYGQTFNEAAEAALVQHLGRGEKPEEGPDKDKLIEDDVDWLTGAGRFAQ